MIVKISKYVALFSVTILMTIGCSPHHEQSTFANAGPVATSQSNLFYLMFWIAALIFVVVQGALIFAIINFRRREHPIPGSDFKLPDIPPKQVHGNTKLELLWTIIPALILVAIAIPTIQVIYETYEPPENSDPLEIIAIGHQWWWEFRYPDEGIVTANELVVPTNRPINVNLKSQDVIHSFWIPQVAGKQDTMPGNTNQMWFQIDKPGNYSGQCAEFCGVAHARMRFRVVANTTEDFETWMKMIKTPPKAATSDGYGLFLAHCSMCHTIDSYVENSYEKEITIQNDRWDDWYSNQEEAVRVSAPNLTHLGIRSMLAAGEKDLTRENLIAWITNPSDIKTGTRMQTVANVYKEGSAKLKEHEVEAIADYLLSQKPENWGMLSGKGVDTEEKEEIAWNTPEEHGKYLFINQGCSGCHSLTDEEIVGPGMQGILGRAATRVSGLTAEEYIYNSIVSPNEYLVEGYPENVMPQAFENLSEEELNALISYLKTIE
ncbi:MAG: cytochrome c oxidase subunit II [Chloroflexota bacterium]